MRSDATSVSISRPCRHCERHGSRDCARDDGSAKQCRRSKPTVIPRAGGGSSTPRLIGSIIDVSGILDHPPSRAMTTEYDFAISRRIAPEVCISFALLENRGRREDRVRAAPAVSCAIAHRKRAHEHTGSAETLRPSLRSGFTAYFVLSPVNGSFATVVPRETCLRELDASTAASGPHDFAVRVMPRSSVRSSRVHRISPHVRDDREPPLIG